MITFRNIFQKDKINFLSEEEKNKMDYKYDVKIKSGTGQYYDYDNCDLLLKRCETHFLPRIQYYSFLVRDIEYWINEDKSGIYVYVIPLDGYKIND